MAAQVTEIKTRHASDEAQEATTAKEQKVGLTMVIEFALENQSIQFSTFAGRDDSPAELNEVLDKIMAAGQRQRNRELREKLRNNQLVHHREIRRAVAQMNEAELRYQTETVERDARKAELALQMSKIEDADRANFGNSGKRGDFKLSAQASQKIAPLRVLNARIPQDQAEQDRVREDAIKGGKDAIKGHENSLTEIEMEIERVEALLAE